MLRFALPRYIPRYIAVTYLVTDPTPTRASDPAAWLALRSCKQAGAAEARFAYCASLWLVTGLVT